jgi:hypothetical protein
MKEQRFLGPDEELVEREPSRTDIREYPGTSVEIR